MKVTTVSGQNVFDITVNECRKTNAFAIHPMIRRYFGQINSLLKSDKSCPILKGRVDEIKDFELVGDFLPFTIKAILLINTKGVVRNQTKFPTVYNWKILFEIWK